MRESHFVMTSVHDPTGALRHCCSKFNAGAARHAHAPLRLRSRGSQRRQLRAKQCGRRFDGAQLSAAWAQSKACIFIPPPHGGALSWPLRTPDRGCALGACLCPRPNRLPMGETTASSSCRTSCRCCYAVTPLPRRAPRPWTCASAISVIRSRSLD